MANYNSPLADGRDASPGAEPRKGDGDDTIKKSNQEQYTGTGVKAGPKPSPSSGRKFIDETSREYGNQLQFSANPYGTGTVKDALNAYKQKTKPAAVNPGPDGRSLGVTRKAPGRSSVSGSGVENF
jgi:hypothetical protein